MKKKWKKENVVLAVLIAILAITSIILVIYSRSGNVSIFDEMTALGNGKNPAIYFGDATPVRGDEITIDVKLTDLKGEYPAASFDIEFDKTMLEFLGIKQGDITIVDIETGEKQIPEWEYNVQTCNLTSEIRTMYLDITGGNRAIDGEQITDENNTLFRLHFRVKDSCDPGDEILLDFNQATFASNDEEASHAMNKENLVTSQGKFLVGDNQ